MNTTGRPAVAAAKHPRRRAGHLDQRRRPIAVLLARHFGEHLEPAPQPHPFGLGGSARSINAPTHRPPCPVLAGAEPNRSRITICIAASAFASP